MHGMDNMKHGVASMTHGMANMTHVMAYITHVVVNMTHGMANMKHGVADTMRCKHDQGVTSVTGVTDFSQTSDQKIKVFARSLRRRREKMFD